MSITRLHIAAGFAVLVVHLLVGLALNEPSVVLAGDSTGYIAQAWHLAGTTFDAPLDIATYSPGYGVLLAPVVALGASIATVVAAAAVINAICGVAVFVGLLRLAHGRVPPRTAIAVALIGALGPGTVLQTPFVWPELLLAALATWWVVAARAAIERRTLTAWFAVAVVAAAAAATHQRMLPVLLLTGVAGIVTLRGWRPRAALGLATAGLALAVVVWTRATSAALFAQSGNDTGSLARGLGLDHLGDLVLVLTGEAWALVVASGGIASLILLEAWRDRRVSAARLLLAATTAVAVLGAVQLGVVRADRPDFNAYHRYVGVFLPAMVVIGLTTKTGVRRYRWIPVAVVVGLSAVLIAAHGPRIDGWTQPVNVLGVLPLAIPFFDPFIGGPFSVVAPAMFALLVVVGVVRGRERVLARTALFALLLVCIAGVTTGTRVLRPYVDFYSTVHRPLVAAISGLPGRPHVYVDLVGPSAISTTALHAQLARPAARFTALDRRRPFASQMPVGAVALVSAGSHLPAFGRWRRVASDMQVELLRRTG